MKVNELSGVLLDYWVARANGAKTVLRDMKVGDEYCAIQTVPNAIRPFPACIIGSKVGRGKYPLLRHWYYPSTVWDHGGPIIGRERGFVAPEFPDEASVVYQAHMGLGVNRYRCSGPTHLIAAMRAYVGSKFGAEVPDEVTA